VRHDLLADCLSIIKNAERIGKDSCIIPTSELIKNVLSIFQKNGYIGEFEYIDDGRGGKIKIKLIKKINNCNAIKPRYSVKKDEFEKWERRYLPAQGLGILILSTSKGILDHKQAKEKFIGGKLLAYIY
jgi:small subunit ribosomal protein S8